MNATSSSLDSGFYKHYETGVEKNRLLSSGSNSLELYRTKEILERFLPRKPATILDVGGGPGRYSFWLASKGTGFISSTSYHCISSKRRKSRETRRPTSLA